MRETNVWTAEKENAGVRAGASGFSWGAVWESAASLWKSVKIRRKAHALHLEETLALGERRMLAIVEWKGEKLLLGVTPQQITLLERRGNEQADVNELQDEAFHQ
jgi:hypothetical protein